MDLPSWFLISTVLLWQKFTPPRGPEIAKAAVICLCLFICKVNKPTITLTLTLNLKPPKYSEKVTHR